MPGDRTLELMAPGHAFFLTGSKSHLRKTNKKRAPRAETVQRFHNSSAWQLEDQFYEFALRQFESVKARTLDAATRHDKGQQFFYEKIRPK